MSTEDVIRNPPERDWQETAACKGMDPNIFHPFAGQRGLSAERYSRRAKSVCATCPHVARCLEFALDNFEFEGVWGGTTPGERRVIAARTGLSGRPPRPIRHGTPGGFSTHRHRGEVPCDACREANNAYQVRARQNRMAG